MKLLVSLITVSVMALPASAESAPTPGVTQPPFVMKTEIEPAVPVKTKRPFKEAHPRLYWCFRKGRTVCIFCEPFVRTAAYVGQIVTPFVI